MVSEGLRSTLVRHSLNFPGGACPQNTMHYTCTETARAAWLHQKKKNTPCMHRHLQARAYLGIAWVISNQVYSRTGHKDTWSPAYSICMHRRTKSVQCSDKTLLWVLYFSSSPFVCTLPSAAIFLWQNTVKPPNKGHIGDGPVVPCREVVLFLEVFF